MNNYCSCYLIYIILLFFNSCKSGNKPHSRLDSSYAVTGEKFYEGLISVHKGRVLFVECSNGYRSYTVKDESGLLDTFYARAQFQSYPGESVYAELNGILQSAGNISASNDTLLIVKSIINMSPKNFRNTCVPYDYWGVGTEPFWSMQISEQENLIDWKNGSDGITYRFAYLPPIIRNDTIIYHTKEINSPDSLFILIVPRICSDGMSEIVYDYEMIFSYNNQQYMGCAIKWGHLPEMPQ